MNPERMTPGFYFMSFGSLHTGRAIGACIVVIAVGEDPNEKAHRLGLVPNECNEARAYRIRDIRQENMQPGRFYSRAELRRLGYHTDTETEKANEN
jgi:hypothetical protein